MKPYTKLFAEILDSTVWQESKETRLVWITMLAKKDKDGMVFASVPGLAAAAKVSLAECETALKVLLSPDSYSRTKDHEGRRISEVSGGWVVLNHFYYRDTVDSEGRREYYRLKKREQRAKKKHISRSKPLKGEEAAVKGFQNGTLDKDFQPIKGTRADSQSGQSPAPQT